MRFVMGECQIMMHSNVFLIGNKILLE